MSKILTGAVFALALLATLPLGVVSANLPVTSGFGWRVHPISGQWSFHTGLDLGYATGTPIPAFYDGIIVESGNAGDGYGIKVTLYHPQMDSYTRYAHMSVAYAAVHQFVRQGDTIGLVGMTGNATGPHLHIEYIVPDSAGYTYTDPLILWQ